MADEVGRLVEEAVHTKTRRCRAMRRSRFDHSGQRPDRSFEWQSGTRTGRDNFVSSCETCWRNGWVLRGRFGPAQPDFGDQDRLRLFKGLRTRHRNHRNPCRGAEIGIVSPDFSVPGF